MKLNRKNYTPFGKAILDECNKQGITLSELAKSCYISETTIYKCLTGNMTVTYNTYASLRLRISEEILCSSMPLATLIRFKCRDIEETGDDAIFDEIERMLEMRKQGLF